MLNNKFVMYPNGKYISMVLYYTRITFYYIESVLCTVQGESATTSHASQIIWGGVLSRDTSCLKSSVMKNSSTKEIIVTF